jgi:hypothetical protein
MRHLLKNVTLFYLKLDPERPNAKYDKERPSWECQIRTIDREQKKEWANLGLNVKAVIPDDSPSYFRVNLKKKSIKADGTLSDPVDFFDGNLEPITDYTCVGNGSIGNVRIAMYNYVNKENEPAKTPVLIGVQVTKHIVYTPDRSADFVKQETEIVYPDPKEMEVDEDAEPVNL